MGSYISTHPLTTTTFLFFSLTAGGEVGEGILGRRQ